MILPLYKNILQHSAPILNLVLKRRQSRGKESVTRFDERRGLSDLVRPDGSLVWVHAASVGEAQSALILIDTLLANYPDVHILVTTGTVSSAEIMTDALPDRAFHQFFPLDHPQWVSRFLDHWRLNFVLWMESELWPNMLAEIKARALPAYLVNARMSANSYRTGSVFKNSAREVLSSFSGVLCQGESDAEYYKTLGARDVVVSNNLKYSAAPLGVVEMDLEALRGTISARPCWVYASSHAGEEALAARVHLRLKDKLPDLLTIIVPRHPERRAAIGAALSAFDVECVFRGEAKRLPQNFTDLYIADTFSELGLFYRLAAVAVVGRSFSDDGGGGHNPIEPAKLKCAVLHGPHVHNLQDIYDEMGDAGAAIAAADENALTDTLYGLLHDEQVCETQQRKGYDFALDKDQALERVMDVLNPALVQAGLDKDIVS